MARREVTQFYDDLDHQLIDEDKLEIIRFSIDDTDYLLDLSRENAQRLRDTLRPYVEAARIAPEVDYRRVNPREIREWARSQGIPIAHRGKIPHEVIDAYHAAN
ncbi:histone [Corynebacterium phocae]|uniref:Histone n=1 Tax=Corynebacterium phocae TaxID=161895 RepID=A0A1L7D5J9_9CORY|nr:Lsr2 family protein [Corynebacterium phocae]APT93446.1 histone [Corynebacterium phocae]KAA8721140.1 Lsr2 family protein [Corynebacterium phocae]